MRQRTALVNCVLRVCISELSMRQRTLRGWMAGVQRLSELPMRQRTGDRREGRGGDLSELPMRQRTKHSNEYRVVRCF